MMFSALVASSAPHVAAATAPAAPSRSAPPPSLALGPLSFDGARLGITVAAWKALPPPPGMESAATPDCGPAIVAGLRADRVAAATPGPGQTTCAYDARFGADVLLHSPRLDARYRVESLRYRFTGGRLGEIDFATSINAYNDVVALLTRQYGAPASTVRDVTRNPSGSFPRVRQTWRAPGVVVTLTDPTDDPLRLAVRIAGAPAG